jgi:hypothetical protein
LRERCGAKFARFAIFEVREISSSFFPSDLGFFRESFSVFAFHEFGDTRERE